MQLLEAYVMHLQKDCFDSVTGEEPKVPCFNHFICISLWQFVEQEGVGREEEVTAWTWKAERFFSFSLSPNIISRLSPLA